MMRLIKLALAAGATLMGMEAAPAEVPPSSINAQLAGDLVPTHDPVMIKERDTFHVFSTGADRATGRLIRARTSKDLIHWTAAAGLFPSLPDGAQKAIPGAKDMWAPDVQYVNGQ